MPKRTPIMALICVAIASAVALTACGESGSTDDGGGISIPEEVRNNNPTTLGACSNSPQSGGTLVYARRAQTQELNPLIVRNGNGDIFAINQIFQGLVRPDPEGGFGLKPAIADRWEASDDGMTYTFHIRDGIKFANGDPVTAEDVKFSLDRFANPNLNKVLSVAAVGYERTEIVDDSTVRVQLSEPVAAFLYNISIYPAFIVPKDAVQKQGDSFFDKPYGTGPFMVEEFQRGSHLTLVRNPNYWEEGKPYLDKVRFDFAQDDNSRMLALTSGKAQMADGVPYSQIPSILDNDSLQLQVVDVPQFLGLWLNHKRPQFKDQSVRQAMQYALDRDQINEAIYNGVGANPNSVLPHLKFDADTDEVEPYTYDLDRAEQLMQESDYPDGFDATLQYSAGFEDYEQLALYLQQAWGAIGINVKLVELDQGTVTDRFYQGEYDMTFPYAQFTSDVIVPDEYAYLLNDPNNGLHGFFSWWHDESIWKQVQKFGTSTSEERRAELWPQIQQAMLEKSPVINVLDLPFVNAHHKDVCGTVVDALGSDHLEYTWLSR